MQIDAAGTTYWNDTWSGLGDFERYTRPIHEQHPVLKRFLQGTMGNSFASPYLISVARKPLG